MIETIKNLAIIAFGVAIVLFFFTFAFVEIVDNYEGDDVLTTEEYSEHVKEARLLHDE